MGVLAGEPVLAPCVGVVDALLDTTDGASDGVALDEGTPADVDDAAAVVLGDHIAVLEPAGSCTGMLDVAPGVGDVTPSPVVAVGAAEAMATASAAQPTTAVAAAAVEITLPIRM